MAINTIVLADMNFKMGHKSTTSHSWHDGCLMFKRIVEQRTNGEIKITIYPNAQLGNQREMTEGCQMGTVDIVLNAPAYLANFVPRIKVFDLPFLFKDLDHAYKTLDTIGMEFDKELQDKGMKLLAYWETGFKMLSNNKHKIEKLEDLNGLKVRFPGSPVLKETLTAMGASAISISWPETYVALQQGTADGQFNPPSIMVANKIHEVQDFYTTNLRVQYGAEPVVMSLKTWNECSSAQQEILLEAAKIARDYQRKVNQLQNMECIQTMQKEGVVIHTAPENVIETLRKRTASVRKDNASEDLLNRIKEKAN